MSIWTHVTGNIRIDSLRVAPGAPKVEDLKELLTEPLTWDKIDEMDSTTKYTRIQEKCKLPMGSEGSLDYVVTENPHKSAVSAFNICIFGDLRDYDEDDSKHIIPWFTDLVKDLKKLNCWIRQAVIRVETEGQHGLIIYTRDGENLLPIVSVQITNNKGTPSKEIINVALDDKTAKKIRNKEIKL